MDINHFKTLAIEFALKVVYAFIIFLLGRFGAKFAAVLTEKSMTKAKVNRLLVVFTRTSVYYGIIIFAVLAALGQLGIQTTSFIALIGAAGLAIGLAFQNSLSNLASGVLLIVFHPFTLGDYIEAGGTKGLVTEIQIFNTIIKEDGGNVVIIPNSKVTADKITIFKKS
ncbi:MAG: mechanosensitive ion channel family protein [Deltaproteobacteria bacterium]